jgi:hypothetical protein
MRMLRNRSTDVTKIGRYNIVRGEGIALSILFLEGFDWMQFDDLKKYWATVQERVEHQKKQIEICKRKKIREIEVALLPPLGSAPHEYRKAYEFVARPPADYEEAPRRAPPDYDAPYQSLEEYARGVRLLEMETARQACCHRARVNIPLAFDKDDHWRRKFGSPSQDKKKHYKEGGNFSVNFSDPALPYEVKAWQEAKTDALAAYQQGVNPFSHEDWRQGCKAEFNPRPYWSQRKTGFC